MVKLWTKITKSGQETSTIVEKTTSKLLLVSIIIMLVAACSVSASPEPVTVNPYNPLLQAGAYSNYQMNHPNAIVMDKEIAERELEEYYGRV